MPINTIRKTRDILGGLFLLFKNKLYSHQVGKLKDGYYIVSPIPELISQIADAKSSSITSFYGAINDPIASKKFGAKNLEEFSHWAWRSCGIVGVLMVLRSHNKAKTMTIMDLVKVGLEQGGYDFRNDRGWYHSSLARISSDLGTKAKALSFISAPEIALAIKHGKNVLASIKSSRGGHLILIYGVKMHSGKIQSFLVRDPNSYNSCIEEIALRDFLRATTNRVVVFSKGARNGQESRFQGHR